MSTIFQTSQFASSNNCLWLEMANILQLEACHPTKLFAQKYLGELYGRTSKELHQLLYSEVVNMDKMNMDKFKCQKRKSLPLEQGGRELVLFPTQNSKLHYLGLSVE